MQRPQAALGKVQPLSSSWVRGPPRQRALSTYTLAELTDEESAQRGLLVVILNVHIDHVYGLTRLLLSGI